MLTLSGRHGLSYLDLDLDLICALPIKYITDYE